MISRWGMLAAGCGVAGIALAYDDGPQQPWSEYRVHDSARPQPPVVETGGAVSVKPPSDATVLFDGSNLDAWQRGNGDAAGWRVEDGLAIVAGGDIRTKESFGAVQLHIEWRVPAGRNVSGQGGGNSGVFFMDMFEVQILQSHDNPTYPDGQAASLYGQHPPLVNATAPQGEWQSYTIAFEPPVYEDGALKEAAKVTVVHNGVIVQHGQRLEGPTRHREVTSYPDNLPATGPIRLQDHGDPIEFRNIWIRPLGERP